MKKISLEEYNKLSSDFRGVWTTDRSDLPNWEQIRDKYIGKRTMLDNENGATVLLIEGLHFEIINEQKVME